MRKSLNFSIVILVVLSIVLGACRQERASHDTYTCPMHPTVLRDKPGTCPVCHMDLVKKVAGAEVEMDNEFIAATQSPNEQVLSSIKTVRGEFSAPRVTIKRTGVVTYDPRTLATVSARIAGRLEQVTVRYPYQAIRKGQQVATIYSPELVTAQRELLYLYENDAANETLIASATQRLRNLGMTDKQIGDIVARGEALHSVPLYSPADGIVIQRDRQAPSAPAVPSMATSADAMAGGTAASTPASALAEVEPSNDLVREGMYVSAGQPLFDIVSTSNKLIEIALPASAGENVRKGDTLQIIGVTRVKSRQPHDDQLLVRVDLIQPYLSSGEPFIKVRAYVRDEADVRYGQLVTVALRTAPAPALWVPVSAVHDMGIRRVVFIKRRGHFTPIEVETGMTSEDRIMVTKGIASGDEIAVNAQFLVDNEGFIKLQ